MSALCGQCEGGGLVERPCPHIGAWEEEIITPGDWNLNHGGGHRNGLVSRSLVEDGQGDVDARIVADVQNHLSVGRPLLTRGGNTPVRIGDDHPDTQSHDLDVLNPHVVVGACYGVVHLINCSAGINAEPQGVRAGGRELMENGVGVNHTGTQGRSGRRGENGLCRGVLEHDVERRRRARPLIHPSQPNGNQVVLEWVF